MEGFFVPLFCNPLTLHDLRVPLLGTQKLAERQIISICYLVCTKKSGCNPLPD